MNKLSNETIQILIILAVFWTIPWKGFALWKAAQKKQKAWFIVLLIINTLAILEILYIFVFQKKDISEENPSEKAIDRN